jgi:hypothetical protein
MADNAKPIEAPVKLTCECKCPCACDKQAEPEQPKAKFALKADLKTQRFDYQASDYELRIMKDKKVVNFSIDKDGVYCTFVKNNKFVEQKERYFTLLEALGNIE